MQTNAWDKKKIMTLARRSCACDLQSPKTLNKVEISISDLVSGDLRIIQGYGHRGTGGTDVLEGCSGGEARGRAKLLHQLPSVHRIQQVDIALPFIGFVRRWARVRSQPV